MRKMKWIVLAALATGAIALLWVKVGVLAALGVAFSVVAYLFVLTMRTAAQDIMRYERDQRPDLNVLGPR